MMKRFAITTVLAVLVLLAPAHSWALDTVRTTKGTTINGTISQTTSRTIVVQQSNGNEQTVAVDEIESIKFSGEPPQLNTARSAAQGGRYDEALRVVERLTQENKGIDRAEIQQDLQFLKVYCTARLAIGGRGDLLTAGKQVREFTQRYPNSFRFLEATQLLGDVLLAVDKPDLAQQQYAAAQRLASTPEVRMRALIAQGDALTTQGEWERALSVYEEADSLADSASSPAAARLGHLARLGKAVCLSATDKVDEGLELVHQVLASTDPEQADVGARAYNALGACHRIANRPKDALLAYLHVDVLYPSESLAHAEALKNLTELWPEVGNAQRAAEAQEILRSRYGNTRWGRG